VWFSLEEPVVPEISIATFLPPVSPDFRFMQKIRYKTPALKQEIVGAPKRVDATDAARNDME
jgi:hypothetical protein